ncbi:hypothetical protein GTP55_21260 [Duganella sp. FT109W]|uniref:MazG C-terminal domain-containing protein n=1 Tax=Duganella margarita TaxID=2692170 RepID=A0ABW9WLC6_9BURK|nr:nucleoside triphosphate pyrophosphohydrolase family protein [Duganella margarita]MYN41891.1 hypothetical protein [Duganella margarita]
MNIEEYFFKLKALDKLNDITDVKLGLFGEVGSILTTAKKKSREGNSFDYIPHLTEELGDALWYFCRLTDRLGLEFSEIVSFEDFKAGNSNILATDLYSSPLAHAPIVETANFPATLQLLGSAAAKLLHVELDKKIDAKMALQEFFRYFLSIVAATEIKFSSVLSFNLQKSEGRFSELDINRLPNFDRNFDSDERLPENFEIKIIQRSNGKSYMKLNDVFIGDPLTDNISVEDGYRFHDVFHMANAAILHWSPTFRSLIRHKRKSDSRIDEAEDGGRAIVIEEGLTAWIFSYAKEVDFFANRTSISFDILKSIKQFVKGYEVENCPVSLWEKSILDGYAVFRELKAHKSGTILGDRGRRTIEFRR